MGFKHGCAKDPQGVCSKCSFPGSDPDSKSELLFESRTVKYAPHGISKHRLWEPYLEKHCPVLQTRKQAWYGERTWHNWLLAAKSPALVSYSQAQLYSARFPASGSTPHMRSGLDWESRVSSWLERGVCGSLLSTKPSVSPNCNQWTKDHNIILNSLLGRRAWSRVGLEVSALLGSSVEVRAPSEGGNRSPSLNLDCHKLTP